MLLTLFGRFEVVIVALTAAVDELLTGAGRGVEEVAREDGAAVAGADRLGAPVGAQQRLSGLSVDERDAALVARVSHANGVRMGRAARVQALVAADARLDAGVGADGTQGALFQDGAVGRAAHRAARQRLVDRSAVDVDAPAELALALLAGKVALERADRRRDGHHQRTVAVLCNATNSSVRFRWVRFG